MNAGDQRIDERALSKLRWRCRRGMLENDLFVERFFSRYAETLTQRQAEGLLQLMDLPDNDLLDLLLARRRPEGDLDRTVVAEVLGMLMTPPDRPAAAVPGPCFAFPFPFQPLKDRR